MHILVGIICLVLILYFLSKAGKGAKVSRKITIGIPENMTEAKAVAAAAGACARATGVQLFNLCKTGIDEAGKAGKTVAESKEAQQIAQGAKDLVEGSARGLGKILVSLGNKIMPKVQPKEGPNETIDPTKGV